MILFTKTTNIEVVDLERLLNFIVYNFFKVILMLSYLFYKILQKLISKKSICSIVTSECVIIAKDLKYISDQKEL